MAIQKIEFIKEIDNSPADRLERYGELNQGETFDNFRLYEVTNDDGTTQFLRITVTHNSYGDAEEVSQKIELVKAVEKTVTVWEFE